MKFLSTILCALFVSTSLYSQTDKFTVKAGENPVIALPKNFRLLNSEFRDGQITYAMGRKSKTFKFNYDLYNHMLAYVNDKNDTLLIKEDASITNVQIGAENFYHGIRQGFFKILATDTLHKLVSNVTLEQISNAREVNDEGYGGNTNGTSASVSAKNGDKTFKRVTTYHLITQGGEVMKATKSTLIKMFHTNEDEVKAYLRAENTDLKKEEELVKAFRYCISLIRKNN